MGNVNAQIETLKTIIKNLTPEKMQQYYPLVNEFYNIITEMDSDIKRAKNAVSEINNLKTNMVEKIKNNQQRISSLIQQIQSEPPPSKKPNGNGRSKGSMGLPDAPKTINRRRISNR